MSGTSTNIPVACPQCGFMGSGNYCSACGARLAKDEGLGDEVGSKLVGPAIAALAAVKTAWLVLLAPTSFFDSYFNNKTPLAELTFPLSPLWRRLSHKPQRVLGPFECLASGLVLAAFCDTVASWMDRLIQSGRRDPMQDVRFQDWFEQQYGHRLTRVDLGHLTGISIIDDPLHQVIQVLFYCLVALLVGLFLRGTRVRRHQFLHYHAYAVGTALSLRAVAYVCGFGLAAVLIGLSTLAARFMVDLELLLLGLLPMIWFLALLPILLFPRVLPITRRRMTFAAICGLALAGALNWLWGSLTLYGMGLVVVF